MTTSVVEGTTCFKEHSERNLSCKKTSCRCWLNDECNLNCAVVASQSGPRTLQEIGNLFGITRMRVCQIEKNIMKKIRSEIGED